SGPGGVGKGTVVEALTERVPDLAVSLSATTRPKRPGEVDGVHYRFLDDRAFDQLVAADGFLEWAEFGGHRYGTPWVSVLGPLAEGRPVVLEVEVQGALQVRERFADAVLIFLRPPSLEALAERLRRRGTDDPERIQQRLEIAREELAQTDRFDHVVENASLEDAVERIARILTDTPAR
ncbi:MAG TPA: guanylate kinase, partial [Egibacteraceae bacterium]|nr:guanylate kinase [Egibacteraceae bacterium]